MEKAGIQEILNALKLYSEQIDGKINDFKDEINGRMDKMDNELLGLNSRMDKMEAKFEERFDRLEKKLDVFRIELQETQETVDFLASKNLQHERKLRNITT
ncbi:hypothetical protein KHA93_21310 [Bacillus sp. FJAT-49732]|uniref:Uncharacterized protein n=1 Tax=Lederbergia citrisecunda TaxID=2833583 RepID=A0A942TSJ3_9BACI|nr:hypothetical protein [Lederbergia citrisecunda]MBS4202152.1 hypothetical protein [Lederbergia citrisecunda]